MLISRTESLAKIFFLVSLIGLFVYTTIAFLTIHSALSNLIQTKKLQKRIQAYPDSKLSSLFKSRNEKPKYILLWTMEQNENPIGEGQMPFINSDCLHQNCYITTDKTLLDITDYDVVVFNVTDLKRWYKSDLPSRRSPLQKYVFFGKQSSYDAPVCSPIADNFFNWTWSYKLYSDIFSPFIEVRDLKGNMVAPSIVVEWKKAHPYDRIKDHVLPWTAKKKAVACVLRRCGTSGKETLKTALKLEQAFRKQGLAFDVYGCKENKCPKKDCVGMVKKDYYFYYVLEGNTVDYVTDEVMIAFDAGVVPIMIGGADYTKFLPPGAYIDGGSVSPENLVAMVFYAIKNPTVYQAFFRWKQSYTIHRAPLYKGLCQLCSMLHNSMLMNRQSYNEFFRRWWYEGPLDQRCMKIAVPNTTTLLSYLNESRGL